MNQTVKTLNVPSLNSQQVEWIINYANNNLLTKDGNPIIGYIQNIAFELEAKTEKTFQQEEIKAS
jgi:hypothetical protein